MPAPANTSPAPPGWRKQALPLIFAHAAFWTLAGVVYGLGRAVHPDMLEVYALGQEPAFGFERHPPLVPWIAAAWFAVMPHTNVAYFLLAALTSAIGLFGIAALAHRLDARERTTSAAVALHALLPFHGLMALVFNHNTVQLAVWPWTTYWLVRSIQAPTVAAGAALGVLAGLCILAKYYAVVLFAALLLATVLHPKGPQFLASRAFLAALVAGAAVLAPHVTWLLEHGFTPLDHAAAQTQREWLITVREALFVAVYALLAFLPLLAILLAALGSWRLRELGSMLWATPERQAIAAIALAPLLITLLIGLTGLAKISIVFTTPCFFLAPFAVATLLDETETGKAMDTARRFVLAAWPLVLAAIAASPLVVMSNGWSKAWEAKPDLATAAIAEWRKTQRGEPALIAGMAGYSDAIAFYAAPGAKVVRSFLSAADAASVSRRLAASGGMIVCEQRQQPCLDALSRVALPGTTTAQITATPRLLWLAGPEVRLTVLMAPSAETGR